MANLQNHINLQKFHTFGIQVHTKNFTVVKNIEDILNIDFSIHKNYLILGSGSNVLFTKDFDGLVIKNEIKGITFQEHEEYVIVQAKSGEIWDEFVAFCVEKNWSGLENLSLIPGTVGASPIQNIGAYGVEIKDFLVELSVLDIKTKKIVTFINADCQFGYRDSIFKNEAKGQYFIVDVSFKLNKSPKINIEYGAIKQELEKNKITNPNISDVRKVVCDIRNSKLPNPNIIGNAGSFFKNPEIDAMKCQKLKEKFPDIPVYLLENGNFKVAAGWLIEQTGWKGQNIGHAGCHHLQALVLVNIDFQANGNEILTLASKIQASVWEKFEIKISPEVNIL